MTSPITWTVEALAHGPLKRVRILANGHAVGTAIVSGAEYDDLAARLATITPPEPVGSGWCMPCWRGNHAACLWDARLRPNVCRCPHRGSTMHGESTSTCARCGQPVPATEATHADCQPRLCNFCTQCGRQLSAEERAGGDRVCLVSCAPLADGIDAATEAFNEALSLLGPPPTPPFVKGYKPTAADFQPWAAEQEPGESEGPDIATSTTDPEQPADQPWTFVVRSEQHTGGESA